MQDVKEERFEEFRVAAHLLEVEALKPRKGNGVVRIVEEKTELPAAHPLRQRIGELAGQSVRQHIEGPQGRIERIQVFNLLVQLAVGSRIKRANRTSEQDLHEESQEI